jgi:diphthine-ammonia ligase
LEIRDAGDVEVLRKLGVEGWAGAALYVGKGFRWCGGAGMGMEMEMEMEMEGVQWIPCQRVWGEDGREVCAVFVGRVDA